MNNDYPSTEYFNKYYKESVFAKWRKFTELDLISFYYFSVEKCYMSDEKYIKELEEFKKEWVDLENNKEISNDVLIHTAIRCDLLFENGVIAEKDINFIRKCAKILEINDNNFLENVIAYLL